MVAGVPLLYLYVFLAWALLIALLALVVEKSNDHAAQAFMLPCSHGELSLALVDHRPCGLRPISGCSLSSPTTVTSAPTPGTAA